MESNLVAELLEGLEHLRRTGPPAGSELDVIQTAMAIEDTLGIVLPDDVLDAAHLGTPNSVRTLLQSFGQL